MFAVITRKVLRLLTCEIALWMTVYCFGVNDLWSPDTDGRTMISYLGLTSEVISEVNTFFCFILIGLIETIGLYSPLQWHAWLSQLKVRLKIIVHFLEDLYRKDYWVKFCEPSFINASWKVECFHVQANNSLVRYCTFYLFIPRSISSLVFG